VSEPAPAFGEHALHAESQADPAVLPDEATCFQPPLTEAERDLALSYLRGILDGLRVSSKHEPSSAAARHLGETGHVLRFGCCAPPDAA
jgi:hypothetical protein